MRGASKIGLVVVVMALGVFVWMKESQRRERLEAPTSEREAQPEPAAQSGSPAWIPGYSGTVILSAGSVKPAASSYKGPLSLRVIVNSKERVSFGFVSRSELNKYSFAKQLESAMERLPCGGGGQGSVSRSCELASTDTDMVLAVADLRDSSQATRDLFDDKRKGAAANVFNTVSVTISINAASGSAR